uniref:ATP synthase F0 subunit 8 n=1 Tax=Popenaias popeii TaxID=301921 RepID=A0A7D5Y3N2_9BIVA|nr:ATP synthase F0 subunit 8 [Popenaias popeii]QLJ92893.1 ATP synthase F0 subunit 8 [Popenaias popeii]
MPQLSPMSWVLVFGFLLVCVIMFMLSVWWGVISEYKIMCGKDKGGVDVSYISSFNMKWSFGKKVGSGWEK